MKLAISLAMAVLIGLCFTPAWAQDEAADESAGLMKQVRWISPFEFFRTDDDSDTQEWGMVNRLELWDDADDSDAEWRAKVNLPDGAKIHRAIWYLYDECGEDVNESQDDKNIFVELARVEPDCADPPVKQKICSEFTQDEPDYVCLECDFVTAPGIRNINNQKYYYIAVVAFDTEFTGSDRCADKDLRFIALKIIYNLRISPAPDDPTFSDVHPGDPFYREIEALAASGITTGFPDGTFRPKMYVKRQAMAAYLARALGLYFGGAGKN